MVQYTYGDSNWKDKLTAYNGHAITYDEIGNPINYYNGTTFEWDNGRSLIRANKPDGTYMSYRYDDSGVRLRKSVNGVATDYFVDGSTIIAEKTGNNTVWYYYDAAGLRIGFTYNGTPYYYIYNAQGDVIGIYNSNQQIVALYNYDSWGKIISITNKFGAEITDTTHIAHINPFRYRGYYYDTETGMYYLNSRYYDPEIGRFINADGYVSTGQDIIGHNMFAYCLNNPMNLIDTNGEMAAALTAGIAIGSANSWNPIGWFALGASATLFLYASAKAYFEHRTLKNGSKKKSNDKHTKPRPGRQSEKKKQKNWNRRK